TQAGAPSRGPARARRHPPYLGALGVGGVSSGAGRPRGGPGGARGLASRRLVRGVGAGPPPPAPARGGGAGAPASAARAAGSGRIARSRRALRLHLTAMVLAELWRYPVKSMAGERLTACALGADGVPGDRVVHVEDLRGRVVTARSRPRLLLHRATLG